jgi:hypothetical protein
MALLDRAYVFYTVSLELPRNASECGVYPHMFFHTLREKEAETIFGVTTGVGVTLLNRNHPFPLLVEMEEKTHGALLANTSHGALYRAFASP